LKDPLASEARSDLNFLERTSRRCELLGLDRPLLPNKQSVSVNTEFQDSMLELESDSESESSFESHSITGKALKLSSKFRLNNWQDSAVSIPPRRDRFETVVLFC